MRVLVVCPYGLKDFGGVANQSVLLTSGLRSAGVDAHLAVPWDDRQPAAGVAEYVWNLGRTHPFEANGSVANVQLIGFKVWRIVSQVRPDLIHLEEPLATGATLSLFVFGRRSRPMVGTFHRAKTDALYKGEGRLLRLLGIGRLRLNERFAVSRTAVETAMEVLGGTETDYLVAPPAVGREWFGVTRRSAGDGTFTIIYWGRIEPRKGVKYLLDAMQLNVVPPWVRLVVVGGGKAEYVQAMKMKVASDIDNGRIQFLGPLDDASLRAEVAGADIAVSPAEQGESFRGVLLEAMAAGLPVIATRLHHGSDPVVQPGVNGYLVAPADAYQLAATIAHCVSAKGELLTLSNGAIETARQFTVGRLVKNTLRVYKRVLETSFRDSGAESNRPLD